MRERNMQATQADKETHALKLAAGLYILIFALKLGVYFMTGVMALLAEALHTLSDIFVSVFLLVAVSWSRKQADEVHMFGYGRAQHVAALVAATLFISFTSYKLYEEAIPRLFQPPEAAYQNVPLALGVILVSMGIAAAPLLALFTHKQRGAAATAQFKELINDELGLLAALAGTLFILWGQPLADPLASIAVATVIAWSAIGLFRENASFLLGRAPGPEFQKQVEQVVLATPGVLGMHDFRAEYVGPNAVHTGMHIEVQRGLAIEEADRIAEQVHKRVEQATGCRYCVIHVEAAEPSGGAGVKAARKRSERGACRQALSAEEGHEGRGVGLQVLVEGFERPFEASGIAKEHCHKVDDLIAPEAPPSKAHTRSSGSHHSLLLQEMRDHVSSPNQVGGEGTPCGEVW